MTSYAEQSDAALAGHARDGDRAAFAVLIDRTIEQVWAVVTQGATDVGHARTAVRATYLDAMRELDRGHTPGVIAPWLTAIADRYAPAERSDVAVPSLQMPAGLADELWRELDRRWPDGREPPRRRVSWRRLGIATGLVLLAALGPVAVLGPPADEREPPEPEATVEASPFASDPSEPEPTPTTQPPPDFEFPSAPNDDSTQAGG